jgi:cytochrome b subunit of formate dehydrogenase
MNRGALLLVGVVITIAGAAGIAAQALSGAQPWGPTLADNMVFAKAIPFTLGLGVVIGTVAGLAPGAGRTRLRETDGAVRRFSGLTVAMHWIAAVGFLLALATGSWQYLKGILDVESPVFMPYVYRVHYVGASLLLLAMSTMVTYWLVAGVGGLLPPSGQRIRHLRGLAHELPRPLGGTLAVLLGLNMRRQPPPTEQFTYYETTISFPTWIVLLGLVTLTGLLKAMRYVYPIPGDLLWWASTLHVASMVLLAAKALDHLRYVLAPSRWSMMTAMVTGWMRQRDVQERHPGWHERIAGAGAGLSAPTESAVAGAAPPPAPVSGSTGGVS